MFGEFSYLVYMLIFTLIPLAVLWAKYFSFLKKNIKIVLAVTLTGVLYQLIVDPFAENWGAWFFTDDRILGIWIFNFPLENIIFFALISAVVSSATLAFIYHFRKKELFKRT